MQNATGTAATPKATVTTVLMMITVTTAVMMMPVVITQRKTLSRLGQQYLVTWFIVICSVGNSPHLLSDRQSSSILSINEEVMEVANTADGNELNFLVLLPEPSQC